MCEQGSLFLSEHHILPTQQQQDYHTSVRLTEHTELRLSLRVTTCPTWTPRVRSEVRKGSAEPSLPVSDQEEEHQTAMLSADLHTDLDQSEDEAQQHPPIRAAAWVDEDDELEEE